MGFTQKAKKRKTPWPWERDCWTGCFTADDRNYMLNYYHKLPKFQSVCYDNKYLDISSKRAANKACASVVSIVTYSGDKEIFQGSGTIIENNGTILTTACLIKCPSGGNFLADDIKIMVYMMDESSYEAELLANDSYYNIAVVKIYMDVFLEPASLRLLDDCISLDPKEELRIHEDRGFQIRQHSDTYVLAPGDQVIALGRYFLKPYDIMIAPGEFCIKRCDSSFVCKERMKATCVITSTGAGGPLVNRGGEVIGIVMCEGGLCPFVPINIVLKWWDHFKKYKELHPRPSLGMTLANLYTVNMKVMVKLVQKNPKNYVGAVVEKVIQGSNADVAGICPDDLIVKCCGKTVRGLLEFYDIMWDNTGKSVELEVIRASRNAPLQLSMAVVEATQIEG